MSNFLKESLRQKFNIFQKYYIVFFKFDTKFYLACNPDVGINGINANRHFRKYGFLEKRVFSITECVMDLIEGTNLVQFQNIFDISLNEPKSSAIKFSTISLPWRIGCSGRPYQFVHVRIPNSLIDSNNLAKHIKAVYVKRGFWETILLIKN